METRPFFHPIHTLPMYTQATTDEGCPVSFDVARRGVMLPTHTQLTQKDVTAIVEAVASAMLETANRS